MYVPSDLFLRDLLNLSEVSDFHRTEKAIQGEWEVAQCDSPHNAVSHHDHTALVTLWDLEQGRRNDLGPTPTGVEEEHTGREHVETNPDRILEQIEFQFVDVTNWYWGNGGIVGPEQLELEDAPEVD